MWKLICVLLHSDGFKCQCLLRITPLIMIFWRLLSSIVQPCASAGKGWPRFCYVVHDIYFLWPCKIFLLPVGCGAWLSSWCRGPLLSAVSIPHEVFTPQKYVHSSTRGSAEGGYPLCGVRGGYPPSGGSGVVSPDGGSGAKPPKEKLPCKCIL